MNARVPFPRKRTFGMFVGAFALLLMWAAFPGPAWAIIGGEPDGNRHPNVGTVIVYHPLYGVIPYFTGTLVDERVFLTAGHGVAQILDGDVLLLGVSFDPEVDLVKGTWLPVTDAVCRWGDYFAGAADPNRTDIGILVLEEPVESVAPATLPPAGFLDYLKSTGQLDAAPGGTEFTVVGYGFGLDWPPPEPIPPVSPDGKALRKMAQTGYRAMDASWLVCSQNPALGYGGISNGDSGGPAFWTDPDTGEEVLVGITSWGGSRVAHGFYYRIDTAESLKFIQDVTDALRRE